MNSGWPNQRFSDARRSTAATTAASNPTPVWKQKKRPFTRPSPIGREVGTASMPPASEFDGGDRIVGQPDRAGEDVRRSAGEHPERGVGAGDPGRHLVERAVAAEPDDDVDVAPGCVEGEPCGVPTAVRLDEFDLVIPRETSLHDDRVARRDRRREGVDDEQDAQAPPG